MYSPLSHAHHVAIHNHHARTVRAVGHAHAAHVHLHHVITQAHHSLSSSVNGLLAFLLHTLPSVAAQAWASSAGPTILIAAAAGCVVAYLTYATGRDQWAGSTRGFEPGNVIAVGQVVLFVAVAGAVLVAFMGPAVGSIGGSVHGITAHFANIVAEVGR